MTEENNERPPTPEVTYCLSCGTLDIKDGVAKTKTTKEPVTVCTRCGAVFRATFYMGYEVELNDE